MQCEGWCDKAIFTTLAPWAEAVPVQKQEALYERGEHLPAA